MFILDFFKIILYEPIYNALIFLVDVVPGGDLGFAIIILTLLVKFILLPVAHKTIKSQVMMKAIEPEVKDVRAKKLDKQQESLEIMEVYKKNKINPFSGCLLLLIQLPIIITLYLVLRNSGLPEINPDLLYSFISNPDTIHTLFLGIFELTQGSVVLALLAGGTQFLQMRISMPSTPQALKDKKPEDLTFQEQFTKNMTSQMKYVLPVFIVFAAYTLSSAIALYWVTNNIFTYIHEVIVRREGGIKETKTEKPEDS